MYLAHVTRKDGDGHLNKNTLGYVQKVSISVDEDL